MGSNRYVQFDPAVIEQARQIDLLSYLQRYEPSNLKRMAGNVYCTREHDSLKISNSKWYWWSRGFGGYSALDYLMKVREFNFVEAVQTLTGDMGAWKPPPPAVKKDEPKVLLLPEKNPNCDKVTEYLFGRGIDYQLIQDCIAADITDPLKNEGEESEAEDGALEDDCCSGCPYYCRVCGECMYEDGD